MISFHKARKLSSYLVRAKLHPIQLQEHLNAMEKRCQTCLSVNETETFTSTTTGQTYKIKPSVVTSNFSCISLLVRSV